MKEITDEEYAFFKKLTKLWYHTQPKKAGSFFIWGDAGQKDLNGLPEYVLICPQMGSDTIAVYEKKVSGKPEETS